MKGKRLYLLITSLDKTEHRQLINLCKNTKDKRIELLTRLLLKRISSEKIFLNILDEVQLSFNNNELESDKKLRRYVDYSCKQIESVLLFNELENNKFVRTKNLAKIFDKKNQDELTKYYNDSTINIAKESSINSGIEVHYDIKMRWLARNQFKQDIIDLKNTLHAKKIIINEHYHEEMTSYYNVLSGLFLDNPKDILVKNQIPKYDTIKSLQKSTSDEFNKLLYGIALARFNFFNKNKLFQSIELLLKDNARSNLSSDNKDKISRSILFLKNTAGLYYGQPINKMIDDAKYIFNIMINYQYYDSISFFFLVFFHLIDEDFYQADILLKKYSTAFFKGKKNEYYLFLQAFKNFQLGFFDNALTELPQLAYSSSQYLAIWSRLLEIKIHQILKNDLLLNSLINRANRYVLNNKEKNILSEPCLYVLKNIENKKNIIKNNNSLFKFYELILAK